MKVIIVGGVAGGASCAARLRRLDEEAEILMVERGPYVSYTNCGLPYHVGGVIEKESSLLVANEQLFRSQFAIDVHTNCEAIEISPKKKTVKLRDVATGEVTTQSYDKLVLSPGAVSVRPPLPGIDLPGIFHVRTAPDVREIREWIERGSAFLSGMDHYSGFQTIRPKTRAVVVGGGFIGLEMVENLVHRGFDVTLVEMLDQVLSPVDPEHARVVQAHLKRHGVRLALNDGVAGFLLDVRDATELAVENVPEALNIPIGELCARLDELPRDREIHVFCRSGQRAYIATRILLQNGFEAKNISGGMLSLAPELTIRDAQGWEMFYNFAVTPWLVLGADLQIIKPGLADDTAVFSGLRTVIRF
jgi:NADPH-dependent 2,4-dienoyl-CoA reductase/sulfur reductase-like enzyme